MLKLLRAWLIFSLFGTVVVSSVFLIPDIMSGKIYDYSSDPKDWFMGTLFVFQTLFVVLLPTVFAAVVLSSLNRRVWPAAKLVVLIFVAVVTITILTNIQSKDLPTIHQPKEIVAFGSFAVIGAAIFWQVSRPENRVEQGVDRKPDHVAS